MYSPLMFSKFMGQVLGRMRKLADLSEEELGKEVGRSERTIKRLEANDRKVVIKQEMEEAWLKVTKTSKQLFGKIAAAELGTYLGRIVRIFPPDTVISSVDLMKDFKVFAYHGYKLPAKEQERIQDDLNEAKNADFSADRHCRSVAKNVIERINEAREALGEDPSKDPEDWPGIDEETRRGDS